MISTTAKWDCPTTTIGGGPDTGEELDAAGDVDLDLVEGGEATGRMSGGTRSQERGAGPEAASPEGPSPEGLSKAGHGREGAGPEGCQVVRPCP